MLKQRMVIQGRGWKPLAIILLLASCAAPTPPRPMPPLLACDSPAAPPATPPPPRTVERLAHFAITLELSREQANASLLDCAERLHWLQMWISHEGR